MSSSDPRDELVAAVLRTTRTGSNRSALFSHAVAERLGLASTDLECLDVLLAEGRLTVGRLAELTGLTTGSATRMVDRLEQSGYVKRIADPTDRRRVLVEPAPGANDKLHALHDSIRSAQTKVVADYNDDQLRLLVDFLGRMGEVVHAEVKSPAMTGQWEAYLKRIQRGEAQLGPFLKGIEDYVTGVVGKVEQAPPSATPPAITSFSWMPTTKSRIPITWSSRSGRWPPTPRPWAWKATTCPRPA